MVLIRNKRGIFFTSLVLVILTLFLLSYTFLSQVNDRKTIQRRIDTMNSFLISVEEDLPRQLKTSGFRIIFLFENRIIQTGQYIDDVETRFDETFFTGTVYGDTNEEIELIMEGAKFSDIEESLKDKANSISADISLSSPIINITQDDPWNIKVILETEFSLYDDSGLVSWNKTSIISAYIPVEGFEDPIYPIESNDPNVINIINRTPYETFLNSNDLLNHATNTYYLNNTNSPSFLDRLEGNLNAANANGIESLAVPKLTSLTDTSIVDYEYFSGTFGQQVAEMPDWFLIDENHLEIYQVS